MLFGPKRIIFDLIKKPNPFEILDKALVIKDAVVEGDKEKIWKVIKDSGTDSLGIEQWKTIAPSYGDHIKVHRVGYTHHGIYVSQNEVIHFASKNNDGLKNWKNNHIISTSLNEFLRGGKVRIRQYTLYEERELRPVQEIVTTARQFLGQDGYNLFRNNCEHFCNLCTFNKKYSKQINNWTLALEKFFITIAHI